MLLKAGLTGCVRVALSYYTVSWLSLSTGVLLPELVLSMILLQAHHPSVAQKSEGICLLRDLLIPINRFNQLAPGCTKEDELDMTWLGTGGESRNS